MADQDSKDIELERELETLYLKAASPETSLDMADPPPPPTTPEAGYSRHDRGAPHGLHDKDREKRAHFRFLLSAVFIVVICVFLLGLTAFFLWPDIYHYDTLKSDGKVYPLRINRLTGQTAYFDGKEWLNPPIPAPANKSVSEIPSVQTAVEIAPDMQPTDKTAEHVSVSSALEKHHGETGYTIQIKAFSADKKKDALLFLKNVERQFPGVRLETVHIQGHGIWHRILLGNFRNKEDASDSMRKYKLPAVYPDSFVQKSSG